MNSEIKSSEVIVETLEKWKGTKIDVELLLETLTKFKNKEQEPLLQFYKGGNFILRGYHEKEPLIDDLKDFIKSKAIVSEEKIQYLQSLLALVEEFRPLDVISVNFETEHTDIRLYKLHGSVMWYQSDRGSYIKLPVMTEESKIQLITGEKAENLMLYPMQKLDYAEPFLELLVGIKRLLESETCKFLIVVGYSFRDEHIRRIIWGAARKNKNLHLLLIDPKAYQIYFDRLKYYSNKHKILSSLRNHYLENLKSGLINETNVHEAEIRGQKIDWANCIKLFANAEYTEKVEYIIQRYDFELRRDWSLSLEIPLKIAVDLSAGGQVEKATKYFKEFNTQLFEMTVERFHILIVKNPLYPDIEINFSYQSGGSHIKWEQFKGNT